MRPLAHLERARQWLVPHSTASTAIEEIDGSNPGAAAMVHRETERAATAQAPSEALSSTPRKGWLARFFDDMQDRAWRRELQQREAYLADAVDLIDVEYRIRRYDEHLAARRTYPFR